MSQKDYWLFVYKSMKSGLLMTKNMDKHLRYNDRSEDVRLEKIA